MTTKPAHRKWDNGEKEREAREKEGVDEEEDRKRDALMTCFVFSNPVA